MQIESLEDAMDCLAGKGVTAAVRARFAKVLEEVVSSLASAEFEQIEISVTALDGLFEFIAALPYGVRPPQYSLVEDTPSFIWRNGEEYCGVVFMPHGQYSYVYKEGGAAPVGGTSPYNVVPTSLRRIVLMPAYRYKYGQQAAPQKKEEDPVASDHTYTRQEMLQRLPVVISDLKHSQTPEGRLRTNKNIRQALYQEVIRGLYSKEHFAHEESLPEGRGGLFVKGYVRDVWNYLESAYAVIHATDFEQEFANQLLSIE